MCLKNLFFYYGFQNVALLLAVRHSRQFKKKKKNTLGADVAEKSWGRDSQFVKNLRRVILGSRFQ